ncbi:MAG: peptidoglycan-binding protein [Gemmatimonadota bacterium]
MANYPLLRLGDLLPSVVVLQKLLNASGAGLRVDGQYGPKTEAAVRDFQGAHRLMRGAGVDEATWARLTQSRRLPIVDCIDVLDAKIYEQRVPVLHQAGVQPLLTGGMQRGIQSLLSRLREVGNDIFLLRIVGHGGPGMQAISFGAGGYITIDPRTGKKEKHYWQGPFDGVGLKTEAQIELFAPVRNSLSQFGTIEMYGCRVASGAMGRRFVKLCARRLGVPVTASRDKQKMGSAFRLSGSVVTMYPGDGGLEGWVASLPDFAPMSVQ